MTVQYGVSLRNARLASDETVIGASPLLRIITGTQPANCGTAQSGITLVEMALPADAFDAPSGGVRAKLGAWSGVGLAAGTAGHYRILDTTGTTCHEQGAIGSDMTIDNTSIGIGQVVTVTTFTRTASGA